MLRWSLLLPVVVACGDPNDPAARAVNVVVLTTARSLLASDTLTLSAQARDAEGRGVADVLLTWSSGDATRLTVVDAAAGIVTALPSRGTAWARVTVPSGATDSVAIRVQPRPTSLAVVSGDAQQGIMNNPLRDPVVVVAHADDGLGVEGVVVAFRTKAGEGAVSEGFRATDSLGRALVQWTLGTDAAQQLTAVTLLPESLAVGFDATALVPGIWTWVSGDSTLGVLPVHGVRSVPAPENTPGSRGSPAAWLDASGHLWLFGGSARNDLWRFDGTAWSWMHGSTGTNQPGVYGTRGLPEATSTPGSRSRAAAWPGSDGSLYLFGGIGVDASGQNGLLNDLWRYSGDMWAWIGGDSLVGATPSYGVRGAASPLNDPGARYPGAWWTEGQGQLWLFGSSVGGGVGASGEGRNDLWRYGNGSWTWIAGDSSMGRFGIYGAPGVAAPSNMPGARGLSVGWMTAAGSFALFGGWGFDANAAEGLLNDTWEYSEAAGWKWVRGSADVNRFGVYGLQAVPGPSVTPGARRAIAGASGSWGFVMFGGDGYGAAAGPGPLNDLWRFDGTSWTWLSGGTGIGAPRVYGSKGVASHANVPGARSVGVMWLTPEGTIWLYGGGGRADLWRYDLTVVP
ncbi:MAG: hypothetical protein WD934_03215 [Gemmatimonadales bacterium]